MKENNSYILDTDQEELYRLGLQHQVWASEAQRGWDLGEFTAGQTILDLGCGPGFCTKELAYLTGPNGKVIGVDRSASYIDFLKKESGLHGLSIETMLADFDEMDLNNNSIDRMYCRWALAWHPNPKSILQKVKESLKVGGKMVIQEYYDWSTHQTEPSMPTLSKAIAAALKSFKDMESEIDIGRHLPKIFEELGMKVTSKRLISKLATPKNFTWHWPKSFYHSYFQRLVEMNYLTEEESQTALKEMNDLEKMKSATLFCPTLIEVIAEKV